MLQQVPFNILFPRIEPLEPFYLPSIQGGLSSKGPYHMLDLYCQDYTCDCHKVSIAIYIRPRLLWAREWPALAAWR